MPRKIHYDPLYGAVAFRAERLGLDDFWAVERPLQPDSHAGELASNLDQILGSYEFNRLKYLRQAGFSWLVYPSASHTRYAHSLGCWYLGEQAMDSARIVVDLGSRRGEKTQKLRHFLIDCLRSENLQEEFMLALLLHDVGHFPFSHVFENNLRFRDISHEQVAAQFILGEGDVFKAFKENVDRERKAYPGMSGRFLCEALDDLSDIVLRKDLVCFLITGDKSHLNDREDSEVHQIAVLQELVSGVIDLDRIDHYHRDSFAMGLRIGYVNPIGLLAGMELCVTPDGAGCWVRLEDSSVIQALALLSTRDMLIRHVFDNEVNVAYELMLNCAVNHVLDFQPEIRARMLSWTDWQLLSYLSAFNQSATTSRLVTRILHGMPYRRVGRFKIRNPSFESIEGIDSIKEELIEYLESQTGNAMTSEDVLVRYPRRLVRASAQKTMWKEWLDMEKLQTLEGITLSEHELYMKQIHFLTEQYRDYDKQLQFFVTSDSLLEQARAFLDTRAYLATVQ